MKPIIILVHFGSISPFVIKYILYLYMFMLYGVLFLAYKPVQHVIV